ncbi:hypothetical protein FHR81_003293 [Actinoalloteichus hoggarensis]|uniref:Uncharacterized protein n=1 Tax=Actinoalloteichus hoggarensis TaxID=1470176 RepID=A0A221W6X6_9PSEU|nr:hypothetical protein [Actinoalloteichus hoggarensis]ASO21648.1 hypothetical protein AHOG_20150 [Actinoalloteichus hoggarensis]MBB5922241.1 hypothetical protein [Actinoalloteichus hoggarensis]
MIATVGRRCGDTDLPISGSIRPLSGRLGMPAPHPSSLRRRRFAEPHKLPVDHGLPPGTNGYTTSWGTNAHGELSACPPGPR